MAVRQRPPSVWQLAGEQHGVVTRQQLLALGVSPAAIRHRLRRGRLHPVGRGVYAVGRRELSQDGRWMAAVLVCGVDALLSHRSAAELWRMVPRRSGPIDVAVRPEVTRRRSWIRTHRKASPGPRRSVRNIPVTDPITTLVDLAGCAVDRETEAAVNEASHLNLVQPDRLRRELGSHRGRRGVGALARLLDRDTYVLTDTELERLFLPLARSAGLGLPGGQVWLSRTRVDFYWPRLGLVVECDSLRFHRTAAKQAQDVRRDQEHVRAGRRALRVTHHQVRHEPEYVVALLRDVGKQGAARTSPPRNG